MSLWTPLAVLGERKSTIVDTFIAVDLLSPGGCYSIKARCWLLRLVRWPQLFLVSLFLKFSTRMPRRAVGKKSGILMV